MRLINTKTRKMEEFIGTNIPKYAILSHTWEEEEVTFNDMMTNPDCNKKKGYGKIDMTCTLAIEDNLDYAWVDTCCIDKSSSAELSEAINSMYRWYQRSSTCYAYLSDLDPSTPVENGLKDCRWFTRGWTLQELIAPRKFEFYDRSWKRRGSKSHLVEIVSNITGIEVDILVHKARLSSVPVGRRMAWAAGRGTTRIEDRAYSLLGIFDVNMPMLYGEEEKAFRRLQEEIIKLIPDLTILAWKMPSSTQPANGRDTACGILAGTPDFFEGCLSFLAEGPVNSVSEMSILNGRLKTDTRIRYTNLLTGPTVQFLDLGWHNATGTVASISLRTCGINEYVRVDPWCADRAAGVLSGPSISPKTHVLTDIPEGYETENGVVGTYYMQPLLLERRSRIAVLHIETPPEVNITAFLPQNRYDPADQLFHCQFDLAQDPVFIGLKLSVRPPLSNVSLGEQEVFKFHFLVVVVGWSWSRLISGSGIGRVQLSIFDLDATSEGREAMARLVEYFIEKGEFITDYPTMKWLNGNDFLKASSTVVKLPDPRRPGLGVRVSATPRVVTDVNISKRGFVRVSISWEVGKIEDLPVSERKPWEPSL